ncbi:MAG: phosphohistidine phosphatase SixA [Nitrospirae bacterium]|nr:phosphohistidine phosphatase SixA [Nitrospirota bacterium]
MYLYLIQHGQAKSEEEDPQRPLNDAGIENIKKTATFLLRNNIKIDKIYHSNKLRAIQTAKVLNDTLKPINGVFETDGLLPLDAPTIWSERLKSIDSSAALVGHLPHLSKLASLLLCNKTDTDIIAFKMAGVVCLSKNEQNLWLIEWMIPPNLC